MKRLTIRNSDGSVSQLTTTTFEAAISRLAAYEDTGLTPDEIERILDAYGRGMTLRTENAERLRLVKDLSTDRLIEIAQAEKDRRLVVLPEVKEADRQTFAEDLKELFDDLSNYDPSVGIFGWSHGEAELANALMTVLTRQETGRLDLG